METSSAGSASVTDQTPANVSTVDNLNLSAVANTDVSTAVNLTTEGQIRPVYCGPRDHTTNRQ
jgi:hypothetical protein